MVSVTPGVELEPDGRRARRQFAHVAPSEGHSCGVAARLENEARWVDADESLSCGNDLSEDASILTVTDVASDVLPLRDHTRRPTSVCLVEDLDVDRTSWRTAGAERHEERLCGRAIREFSRNGGQVGDPAERRECAGRNRRGDPERKCCDNNCSKGTALAG
jgi:hypothetical protein